MMLHRAIHFLLFDAHTGQFLCPYSQPDPDPDPEFKLEPRPGPLCPSSNTKSMDRVVPKQER